MSEDRFEVFGKIIKDNEELPNLLDNYLATVRLNELNNALKTEKEFIIQQEQEIEKLKQQYTILENENGKLTTELIMDKYKKAQKEVSFGMQLAIQELEKVKNYCDKQFNLWENNNFNETYDNTDVSHAYFEIAFIIKEKIKELKGE